jgi:hypothetical protein
VTGDDALDATEEARECVGAYEEVTCESIVDAMLDREVDVRSLGSEARGECMATMIWRSCGCEFRPRVHQASFAALNMSIVAGTMR